MNILVLGAGMAGLSAARALVDAGETVTVLEARNRIGGRVYTNRDLCDIPVEFGAELIHGHTIPTWELIRPLGLRTIHWTKTNDSMVRLANGDWQTMTDARRLYPDFDVTRSWDVPFIPVADGDEPFDVYLQRLGFTETQMQYVRRTFGNSTCEALGYNSAAAMVDELSDHTPGAGDHRLLDGYDCLIHDRAKGLDIHLETVVESIDWTQTPVSVHTTDGSVFEADKIVITLPVGVLQSGHIRFIPDLPDDKQAALSKLKMGPAIKMMYKFDEPIQPGHIMAIYSSQNPPMWWSPSVGHGRDYQIWTAFATGDWARGLLELGENGALQKGLETLRAEVNRPDLKPVDARLMNWPAEPFTLGGYSVALPGGTKARAQLAQPTANRLYWAGEATASNAWAATVHGAYVSGKRVAEEILVTRT